MENNKEPLLEHIIQTGLCSMESIEDSKNYIRSLESQEISGAIRTAEKKLGALSDPIRLKIFLILKKGEKCVCEIEYLLNMPQSSVSRNLKILENSDLIRKRKNGKWAYYSVSDVDFGHFIRKICGGA